MHRDADRFARAHDRAQGQIEARLRASEPPSSSASGPSETGTSCARRTSPAGSTPSPRRSARGSRGSGCRSAQVGSSASISPPAQAQSAGDQNMSPGCGKKSCECTKPGRLPMSSRCASSAPLGATGGAAGVDDERGIVRRGVCLCEFSCLLFEADPPTHAPRPRSHRPRRSHASAASACLSIAHRLAMVVGSTNATLAPANSMRYSSASGPNRCDSGSAMAPIWKIAM